MFGVLGTLAAPPGAPAQVGLATEFQVNTYITHSQLYPSVAVNASGDLVVVWQSETQDDGLFRGIFAQRFSSEGVPLAGEFQVNSYTPGNQVAPAVAVGTGGAFMVAWHGSDGSAAGVFARLFSSAGVPLDHDFQVIPSPASSRSTPTPGDTNAFPPWADSVGSR